MTDLFHISQTIQISHSKKRHNLPCPQYQAFNKTNPVIVPSYPPMEPDHNKQLIPQRKRRLIARHKKINIKTFQQTILYVLLVDLFATATQPYMMKQIIPLLRKKILKRRRLNLKYGTPKTVTFQKTNPSLDPSIWTAPIQPDPNKQSLAKRIKAKIAKRRRFNLRSFPDYQTWFLALLETKTAEIQPYLYKQFIPKWKKKIQNRRRFNLKRFPQWQTFIASNPSLATSIYTAVIQPDRFKQLIPKLKRKVQIKRRMKGKYGTPKYQAWWATNPALNPSVWVSAVQPYLLKQLIPKFKHKILQRKKLNMKYGEPRFQAWFKNLPVIIPAFPPMLPDRFKQLIPKMRHRKLERRRRMVASESPINRYQSWGIIIPETLEDIALTVIDILNKVLRVTK